MKRGFTLIELMVSVAMFTVVMVIALGALLAISHSDRKAETLKSVINNLNFALESMSRTIRTGVDYHCGSGGTLTEPLDCTSGSNYFAFEAAGGSRSNPNDQVVFSFRNCGGAPTACASNHPDRALCGQLTGDVGCIMRSLNSGGSFAPITASEVIITDFSFFTRGALAYPPSGGSSACNPDPVSSGRDCIQPRVVIILSGYVHTGGAGTRTSFNLQTSIAQRLYDQ